MDKRCMGCMGQFSDEFGVCPHCGYAVGTHAEEAIHMEPGTLLHDRYIVGKVLGYGGFGVTYIGWDGKLEQRVAIKEYLPGEFSTRMPGQSVITVFNGNKSEQFRDGMVKFVEEAKHLAKFQNENGIVKVFDSFEENATAYIIMEYLDGETLTDYLSEVGTIPYERSVEMLMPIMKSLMVVHEHNLLHRDIAPDNIFITKTGEVKLIDFGASRYATTSHSRSLTVIIKPGYSPEEQYRSRGDQGPYTDVYAVAAVLYRMITGKTPPDAMERRAKYENENRDILTPPHKFVKKLSVGAETAILNAMNVRIEDRTQNISDFITELYANPPAKRRYGKIKKIDLYRWPMWLKVLIPSALCLILVFSGLLVTGVINFSQFTDEIVIPENIVIVPDVEGFDNEEAIRLIEKGKLLAKTGGTIQSEYIDAGKIVLQNPLGGSYSELNSDVVLLVSSGDEVRESINGKSLVPFVIWDKKEDAVSKFIKAGLGTPIIKEIHDENVTAGHVISQSIAPDTEVDEGTVITLEVSLGPEAFELINIEGKTLAEAQDALIKLGLTVSIEYQKSDTVGEGRVISQDIPSGEMVQRGDNVVIVVSSGKDTVEVPDVAGKARADAESELKDAGFKVNVLENYNDNVEAGYVIAQMPKAGGTQIRGSEITIIVSKGAKEYVPEDNGYEDEPVITRPVIIIETASRTTRRRETTIRTTQYETATTTIKTTVNNNVSVYFNFNGGDQSNYSKNYTANSTYGELPYATRSGYNFKGWFTSTVANGGGIEVTKNSVVSNITLYARWESKNFVDYNSRPSGSRVISEQWEYQKTTNSSKWQVVDKGTHYYAFFPDGFPKDDSLRVKYENGMLSGIETSTYKCVVSEPVDCSNIYWHWNYKANNTINYNRYISDKEGVEECSDGKYYNFCHFVAFEDPAEYGHKGEDGREIESLYVIDRGVLSDVSWWWFKIDIYKQTYEKSELVNEVTTKKYTSTTPVTEGNGITITKHEVKYII